MNKINLNQINFNGTVTEQYLFSGSGKVKSDLLPSYVDEVLEFNSLSDFPETGEEGKIYVAKDTNFTYRWSGSTYIKIGGPDSTTYKEFLATFTPGEREAEVTTQEFLTSVYTYGEEGNAYLGEVYLSDFPKSDIKNAECLVTVTRGAHGKQVIAEISSSTTSPYYWRASTNNAQYTGWIGYAINSESASTVIEGYYNIVRETSIGKFYLTRTGSGTHSDPYVYSDEVSGESGKIYFDKPTNRTFRWVIDRFSIVGTTMEIPSEMQTLEQKTLVEYCDYLHNNYPNLALPGSIFTKQQPFISGIPSNGGELKITVISADYYVIDWYSDNTYPHHWYTIYEYNGSSGGIMGDGWISDTIQITNINNIPTPGETNVGKVFQYIGSTESPYIEGRFYKCIWNSQSSSYIWSLLDTQAAVKTVNNLSPDTSGNVKVTTFSAVPSSMQDYKTGTLEEFCKKFTEIIKPQAGSAYLAGEISFSNLPKSINYQASNSCELFIYVPNTHYGEGLLHNVVYILEITSTNCFNNQWNNTPGKWMAIFQDEYNENGDNSKLHMPWQGMLGCPQSSDKVTVDGVSQYVYKPTAPYHAVSKYWLEDYAQPRTISQPLIYKASQTYTLVANEIATLDASTAASGDSISIALPASPAVTDCFDIQITLGAVVPTINFPEGAKWLGGSAPTPEANKVLEVNVMNGLWVAGSF